MWDVEAESLESAVGEIVFEVNLFFTAIFGE